MGENSKHDNGDEKGENNVQNTMKKRLVIMQNLRAGK